MWFKRNDFYKHIWLNNINQLLISFILYITRIALLFLEMSSWDHFHHAFMSSWDHFHLHIGPRDHCHHAFFLEERPWDLFQPACIYEFVRPFSCAHWSLRPLPSCIFFSRRGRETISIMHSCIYEVRETISICKLVPETVAIMHFSSRRGREASSN